MAPTKTSSRGRCLPCQCRSLNHQKESKQLPFCTAHATQTSHWWRLKRFWRRFQFHKLDSFPGLITTLIGLVVLTIVLTTALPGVLQVHYLENFAFEQLSKHRTGQWALCPGVMGWMEYAEGSFWDKSYVADALHLSCTHPPAKLSHMAAEDAQIVQLPPEALVILSMFKYFYEPSNVRGSRWCYGQKDLPNVYDMRDEFWEENIMGDNFCIHGMKSMNPDSPWNLSSLTSNSTLDDIIKYKAHKLNTLVEEWTFRDIVLVDQKDGGNGTNMTLVLRLQYEPNKTRYDYVLKIPYHEADPLNATLTEALQEMKAGFPASDWGYMYQAFVDVLQRNSMTDSLDKCLLSPITYVQINDNGTWDFPRYRCTHRIDVNNWTDWLNELDVQKALYPQKLLFNMYTLDFDAYQATWTGLYGAFLSTIFVFTGLFVYFLFSVWWACRKDMKEDGAQEAIEVISFKGDDNDDAGEVPAEAITPVEDPPASPSSVSSTRPSLVPRLPCPAMPKPEPEQNRQSGPQMVSTSSRGSITCTSLPKRKRLPLFRLKGRISLYCFNKKLRRDAGSRDRANSC